jgi:hypothetical protein
LDDSAGLPQLIRNTRRACQDALARHHGGELTAILARGAVVGALSSRLVRSIGDADPGEDAIRPLTGSVPPAGVPAVERVLLLRSAIDSLDSLAGLPVCVSVKRLFCETFMSWTRFDEPTWAACRAGTARWVDMCMTASLRRFPAGQFDWVRSGLPLSYLLRVNLRALPRAVYATMAKLGGRRPVFFSHLGYSRFGERLNEEEANRSYLRMAASMALQPDILGMVACSWFRSPDTHRVSPHLAWVNRVVVDHGGFAAANGRARPDCGVFVRSETRRRLYERGAFTPTTGLVIWPRRAMLSWAAAHPEFADHADHGVPPRGLSPRG